MNSGDKSAKGEKKCEEDEIEDLLEKLANQQLRADYRKALGSEYKRRYMDAELEKIFRKKKDR